MGAANGESRSSLQNGTLVRHGEKKWAEFSDPDASRTTFQRKLRGLQLMSAEQVVASATRRGRPTRSAKRPWVNQKRRFLIEHLGKNWTLQLRIENRSGKVSDVRHGCQTSVLGTWQSARALLNFFKSHKT